MNNPKFRKFRKEIAQRALPEVEKLVKKFDLPAVKKAVNMLYEALKAERELKEAEARVAKLKGKLSK